MLLPVSDDVTLRDGEIVQINEVKAVTLEFSSSGLDAYDLGLREFPPYNQQERGDFPFGRKATLEETMNSLPRVELSFPDRFPSPLSFVEPVNTRTSYPLIRIKENDERLFGSDVENRTLVAHELGHALHFAFLPLRLRVAVETKYALWLTRRVLNGQPPFHSAASPTSPFVAYIEAFGLFSERHVIHKVKNPDLNGLALHQNFFYSERNRAAGNVMPLTGADVEGAVMGTLFVDFADSPLTGLGFVVNTYVSSCALSFDDYRNFIRVSEGVSSERFLLLDRVAKKWGM